MVRESAREIERIYDMYFIYTHPSFSIHPFIHHLFPKGVGMKEGPFLRSPEHNKKQLTKFTTYYIKQQFCHFLRSSVLLQQVVVFGVVPWHATFTSRAATTTMNF